MDINILYTDSERFNFVEMFCLEEGYVEIFYVVSKELLYNEWNNGDTLIDAYKECSQRDTQAILPPLPSAIPDLVYRVRFGSGSACDTLYSHIILYFMSILWYTVFIGQYTASIILALFAVYDIMHFILCDIPWLFGNMLHLSYSHYLPYTISCTLYNLI